MMLPFFGFHGTAKQQYQYVGSIMNHDIYFVDLYCVECACIYFYVFRHSAYDTLPVYHYGYYAPKL